MSVPSTAVTRTVRRFVPAPRFALALALALLFALGSLPAGAAPVEGDDRGVAATVDSLIRLITEPLPAHAPQVRQAPRTERLVPTAKRPVALHAAVHPRVAQAVVRRPAVVRFAQATVHAGAHRQATRSADNGLIGSAAHCTYPVVRCSIVPIR